MPEIAQLIGGAGTGKTTRLLEIMAKVIERGISPLDIGFVSFTRAARREASTRAAAQFGGVTSEQLEQEGWFRTLHSICYRALGVGKELLTDNKESRDWLSNALQGDVKLVGGDIDGQTIEAFGESTDIDKALMLWHASRNRLQPLRSAYDLAAECAGNQFPSWEQVSNYVKIYEQAKRLDHRCDFTDLLAKFAGYWFSPTAIEKVDPQGDVPYVQAWFLDEQQDTSALLDAVCRRLVEPSQWCYVVGDPFQAIYGWAGADPSLFQKWNASKREILRQSYRCPDPMVQLGERILRAHCSDYWDRQMKGAAHGGAIDVEQFKAGIFRQIEPGDEWLILARSNFHARRVAGILDSQSIPWIPTRGGGGWGSTKKHRAIAALYALEKNKPIDVDAWRAVVDQIPQKSAGFELLVRGAKAKWSKAKDGDATPINRQWLTDDFFGCTPQLLSMIESGKWGELIDKSSDVRTAIDRWGAERAIGGTKVRVGTIHSAKGAEADNVMLLTTASAPISRAIATQEGENEEGRVWYVGATRARKRLIVTHEPRAPHKISIPA